MTFRPEETASFLALFEQIKDKIRAFEGCEYLELMEDFDDPNSLCTYSKWQNEQALENYRQSALFDEVWAKTKALFASKPLAFSLKTHTKVDLS